MRFVVVGAGAVGATLAGRLALADQHVLLVARGAHYEAIRDHGLTLASADGETTVSLPVCNGVDSLELGAEDILVLAIKTGQSAEVLAQLSSLPLPGGGHAGLEIPIVLAQNGVENERLALRWFRRVYGMSVALFAEYLLPGAVRCSGELPYGVLDLGRYPEGTDDMAETTAEALRRAGYDAAVQTNILSWKYAKLTRNLVNALRALTDDWAATKEILALAVGEAEACFAAAGIENVPASAMEARRGDLRHPADIHGSTWQSLARGTGSVETDYLNGEIVLLGRLHSVPTPVNEGLQLAMNRASRHRANAGSMSGERVRAELGLSSSSDDQPRP